MNTYYLKILREQIVVRDDKTKLRFNLTEISSALNPDIPAQPSHGCPSHLTLAEGKLSVLRWQKVDMLCTALHWQLIWAWCSCPPVLQLLGGKFFISNNYFPTWLPVRGDFTGNWAGTQSELELNNNQYSLSHISQRVELTGNAGVYHDNIW